jgi:hypothetical protein
MEVCDKCKQEVGNNYVATVRFYNYPDMRAYIICKDCFKDFKHIIDIYFAK